MVRDENLIPHIIYKTLRVCKYAGPNNHHSLHSIIYKCLFLFFFTSIDVYTYWSHWRTTSIFLHASFSPPPPLNIISSRWNCMTGCQRNLYSSRAVCGPTSLLNWKKNERAIELEKPLHPTASNKVRLLLRRVLLLLLGCNQVEWMWHSPPLHTQVYISLYERVSIDIESVKKGIWTAQQQHKREKERAIWLGNIYIS